MNIFYTAPTAIRALIAKGDQYIQGYSLSSLRVLGTVGEPINPEVWEWYFRNVGKSKCEVIDTWWQTETGSVQSLFLFATKCLLLHTLIYQHS